MENLQIRLFPENGPEYSETVEIDLDLLEKYSDLIEYVQEVHTPQHEWSFTF